VKRALVLLCLGLGCAPKSAAPVDPSSPPPRLTAATTPEPPTNLALAPDVAPQARTTDIEAPRDLVVHVDREADGLRVRASRPGYLVALRRGEAGAVGEPEARLGIATAGTVSTPIVWETTTFDTLATTRGTIGVDGVGAAHVAVDADPREVAEDAKHGHRCRGHEDGAGGFTVVCRTGPIVAVRNLATDEQLSGVTTVGHGGTFVRLDMPARPDRADAFVIAYADRSARVVIRAEASRVAGEPSASLALVSADRVQAVPAVSFPPRMHPRREASDFDFEL
jgi:hypothetical protein